MTDLITKQIRSEDGLIESERFAYKVLNASLNGICIHDVKHRRQVFINKQCTLLTGYTLVNLETMNEAQFFELFHPDDRQRMTEHMERLVRGKDEMLEIEYRFRTRDGRWIWCLSRDSVFARDHDGSVSKTICTFIDITDRKMSEQTLRESENRYRELVQNANSAIIRWRYDGTITFFNEYAQSFFGYSAEEVLGKHVSVLIPQREPTRADLTRLVQDIVDHPQSYVNTINENVCQDGRRVWMTWTNKAILGQNGWVVEILSIGSDITEQKRAEEALRESEERFRLFIDNSPTIAWMKDEQGRHVYLSKAYEERFGVKLVDWRGKTDAELWPTSIAEEFRRNDLAVLAADQAIEVIEKTVNTDGSFCFWLNSKFPFRNAAGNRFVAGIGLDITERQRTAETLRDSEAKMKSIFRAAPIGIGVVSNRILQYVNERFCKLTGYSRDELIGQSARIIYPADEDYVYVGREKYRQIKKFGIGTVETRLQRKDGKIIKVLMSSTPIDPNNLALGVTFTALDITERKQAEDALRVSEERLKEAQKIAKIGSWWWDISSGHAEWSDQVYEIFKAPRKALSHDFAKSFVHPGDLYLWHNIIQQAVETKKPFTLDYRAIRSDGKTIWVHNEAKPVFNEKGEVAGYKGTVQDITERKLAEEALKESEERLRLSLAGSGVSFWEWFPESGRIYFDDHWAKIIGFKRGRKIFDFKSWIESIHPDCKPVFEKTLNDYLEGKTPRYELEYKIKTKTGAWKWIWAAGECVEWDNNKKPVRILGTHKDITERKRAEEILRKYNKQLELEVRNRTAEIEKQCHQLEELNLLLKQMAQHTIEAMENDRKALSKEIHDGIGGSLAAIKMLLEARLQSSDRPSIEGIVSLDKIIGHLALVIEESRRISYQMRPLNLDDFGLAVALSEYVDNFKEFYPKIDIVSQIDISYNDISDEIKTVLYRLVQEALNNIVKHSGADVVTIEMSESQDRILLKIKDNGCGFEVSKLLTMGQPLHGYGMHSMKERVEICKGTFQLKTEPGRGTLIIASIPKAMM